MKRISCLILLAILSITVDLSAGFDIGITKAIKRKVDLLDNKVTDSRKPVVSFGFSPSAPTPGQTVSFIDVSTNTLTSWSWAFGDGATSTSQNPAHAYSFAGTYAVTLTGTNAWGSSTARKTVTVTAAAVAPVAAFSFSPSSPTADQTVTFTDVSTHTPTSWSWTFGDGGTSTSQNPTHAYTPSGTYMATLTASNSAGSNAVSRTVTVNPSSFSLASSAFAEGGTLPYDYACDGGGASPDLSWNNKPSGTQEFALTMKTITADGTPKWNWVMYSIPGTTTGLAKNTSGVGVTGLGSDLSALVYNPPCSLGPGPRTYTLTLYALSESPTLPAADQVTGAVLISAISSITISSTSLDMTYSRPAPTAAFTFSPSSPSTGTIVAFMDTSTRTPTGWYWDFGDGATSSSRNSTHAYSSAGTYTASLTASNPYGSSSSSQAVTVSATGILPTAAFSFYPSSPTTYNTVSFTDFSLSTPTAWAWNFGDSAVSTAQYPTHVYGSAGTYTVTLTATNSSGSSTSTHSVTVAVPAYNIAQGVSDQAQGTTLAFDALGLMNANLGAESYFPPGKVADYTGFQFLRDSDPSNMGHNPDFTGLTSNSVIRILTDSQLAQLAALAVSQADLVNQYAYHRFTLIKAFRRLMDGDMPSGTAGLSMSAVTGVSQNLYAMDGQIAFDRALLYANIYKSMTRAQLAALDAMKGVGASSWTVTDANFMKARVESALGLTYASNATMNTLVQTYAGDLYSWYSGTVEADVYFCPERHGTYYGGFYIKDAPAMNAPQGVSYTIDSALTGNAGASLLDSSLGYVTPTQAAIMTNLMNTQKSNMNGIVQVRTQIAALLRTLLVSTAASDSVRAQVLALSSGTYGTLDGRNNYYYATAFKQVHDALSASQRAKLKTDFWDGLLISTYTNGKTYDYSVCKSTYLYSDTTTDPSVLAQIQTYIDNTDSLFSTDPPSAAFSFSPSTPTVGQTITFTDASDGPPTSWSWDFGDGGTSASQNPTHSYDSSGTYTVSLTATNAIGSSSISHTLSVSQGSFTLVSGAGASGGAMTLEYSCSGAGSSPAMSWTNAPSGTQQFALTMSEVTPQLETKYNWVLYGIPSGSSGFAKNTTGGGTLGESDGTAGTAYSPPCGPGNRLYTYRLYALSGAPSLSSNPAQVTGSVLATALAGITISSATMTLTYTAPSP